MKKNLGATSVQGGFAAFATRAINNACKYVLPVFYHDRYVPRTRCGTALIRIAGPLLVRMN